MAVLDGLRTRTLSEIDAVAWHSCYARIASLNIS